MLRVALTKSFSKSQNTPQILIQQYRNIRLNGGDRIRLQEAGFGKYLIILTPFAIGGGIIAYAKYDEKFRKTVEDSVPGARDVIKLALQEEGNILQDVTKTFNKTTQSIKDTTNSITGYFSKDDKLPPVPVPKSTPNIDVKPVKQSPSKPDVTKTEPPLPKIVEPPPKPTSQPPKPTEKVVDVKPTEPVPFKIPSDIKELEHAVEVAAQTAIREYSNAIKILKGYNEVVKRVVDQSVEKLDHSIWNTLKNQTSARDTSVQAAETSAQQARTQLETLEKSIGIHSKDANNEKLQSIRHKIRTLYDHLNKARDELYSAKDLSNLSEKYWRKVESARNYFVDEVEALFPGVNLTEKKIDVNQSDLDLFILYAYSHVLAYQKELQKMYLEGETRLQRAIDALNGNDSAEALQHQLEYYLEKEKQKLNLENQKNNFKVSMDAEKGLRENLKRLSEAHVDHINDVLKQKEEELRRVFNRELNEKLSVEQSEYKLQLASTLGKLKGMENALKARVDAERLNNQSQALWSSCQTLWASVRSGKPGVSWRESLRPLESEVAAVSRAAEGDELVKVVLDTLPDVARNRGVYPEDALRERFFNVEKLARRLALVPETGARLPMYLLSYFQSMLIITPSNPISKEELNDEPVDFSKLDTYDILNRSKYWVERGNFVKALQYMNLLQGAPRNVAKDWLSEVRLLLETQQAANVLMAHAATSGLSFL